MMINKFLELLCWILFLKLYFQLLFYFLQKNSTLNKFCFPFYHFFHFNVLLQFLWGLIQKWGKSFIERFKRVGREREKKDDRYKHFLSFREFNHPKEKKNKIFSPTKGKHSSKKWNFMLYWKVEKLYWVKFVRKRSKIYWMQIFENLTSKI